MQTEKKTYKYFSDFLTANGWEFYQDSPNEGKWFKFDKDGNRIAVEGDLNWKVMLVKWETEATKWRS